MDAGRPNYSWFVVAYLFVAAALNYGDRTAITAVFPLLKKELGMSDVALAATGSFFLWGYAAASPFAGYLGDRVSRSKLLIGSLALWSLVMFASGFATNSTQLLVLRSVLGIPEAAYIPAATALIADFHGPATRAKAIGLHIAGLSTGMVAGGWLSGYLGDHFGWRPSFLLLGGLGLAWSVFGWFTLTDAPRHKGAAPPVPPLLDILRELARIPSFLVLTAEIVLSGAVSWIFINWLPLYFKETFNLSLAMAGLWGTLWIQGGRVAGLLGGGVLSDRLAQGHPRRRLLAMSAFYIVAAPILLGFTVQPAFALVAATIFAYSLLIGMGYVNSQPLLCELIRPELRSTAIGMMNMGACFAGGAGVLVAGWIRSDVTLARSFASLSAVVVVVSLILLTAYYTVLPRDLRRAAAARQAA